MTHTERTVARLRRRLASAELELLRELVAEQASRIEALEAELAAAYRDADISQRNADVWQDMWQSAIEHRADAPTLGITQAGEVLLIPVATH